MEQVQTEVGEWPTNLLSSLPQAGLKFLTVASNLIFLVIIPVLSFFFLKDGEAIREHMLDLVEAGPRRALLDDVLADTHLLLAHYMRAQAMMSLAAFTAYSIFFTIIGVPYGVLLAAVACLLEIVPMIGPLSASVAILGIAAVAGHVLAVLIFLVAYRMAADYVLSPHLMGQGVQLHPLLVLFGVFAGAEVAGVAGTFISVPVLAMARIIYLRVRKSRITSRIAGRPSPTPTVAL
jgi:predicted PurR-regulated permease PerM